jgi:hypothetical protein
MPAIESFAASGRSRAASGVCATLFLGVILLGAPIMAQTTREGVPSWQLPPVSASQPRIPTVERTAYNPEEASVPEGSEGRERRAMAVPPQSPRSISQQDEGGLIANDLVEGSPYQDDSGSACDYGSCFCPFQNRLWVRGEYLSMWSKSANVPPLATSSTAGTARNQAGVLGLASTQILFGAENVDYGSMPGARFTLGYWLDACQESGFEASYMFLGSKSVNFGVTSSSTPILAVPFWNVQTGNQDAAIIAFPAQQTGSMNINLSNEFHSLELLWRRAVLQNCAHRLDFLAGYRYGRFSESLTSDSTSNYLVAVGGIPAGTTIRVFDQFSAANDFNGAELGFSSNSRYSNFSLELLGKLALGDMRSIVTIDGATIITPPQGGSPVTNRGGLLALPTNIGVHEQNNFAVVPELGLNVGYNFTCRMKATVGYSIVYLSHVARPSDQIDTNVNPTQIPPGTLNGTPSPQFKFIPGDDWVQGLTAGIDYRF